MIIRTPQELIIYPDAVIGFDKYRDASAPNISNASFAKCGELPGCVFILFIILLNNIIINKTYASREEVYGSTAAAEIPLYRLIKYL